MAIIEPGEKGDNPAAQRRRRGWFMILCGWGAALAVAVVFFGGVLDRQHNPNSIAVLANQSGDNELLLRANDYGHYYAEGTMNGERVLFLLDTGATQIAVPQSIAERIGLKPGAIAQVQTANGIAKVRSTYINRITIGNISLAGLRGAILPQMEGDAILLGMNALGKLNLSQQNGELLLSIP